MSGGNVIRAIKYLRGIFKSTMTESGTDIILQELDLGN